MSREGERFEVFRTIRTFLLNETYTFSSNERHLLSYGLEFCSSFSSLLYSHLIYVSLFSFVLLLGPSA
jgi:hypothetical protein